MQLPLLDTMISCQVLHRLKIPFFSSEKWTECPTGRSLSLHYHGYVLPAYLEFDIEKTPNCLILFCHKIFAFISYSAIITLVPFIFKEQLYEKDKDRCFTLT